MSKLAYTATRPIQFTLASSMPIDAIKAVVNYLEGIEFKIAREFPYQQIGDGEIFLLSGQNKQKVYQLETVTMNYATGDYSIDYLGEADNVDGLS